jgi:type I restriction enzyme M protein
VADQAKALIKEIDHLAKLAQKAQEEAIAGGEKAAEGKKLLAAVAEARVLLTGDPDVQLRVTGTLKRVRYFEGQAEWLLSRFPEGKLRDVEGLVKLVDQEELAANDYSLTPGRYVGVAPQVDDEDFDFEETIKEIHLEIEGLNAEASELAETIAKNFEEIIV